MPPPRPARPATPRGTAPARPRLPRHGWQRRELVIWGAHGGAGHQHAGGLAAARLGHGRDAPRARPALPGARRQRPGPGRGLPQHRLVGQAGHQGGRRGHPAGRPGRRAGRGQRRLARARRRDQPVPPAGTAGRRGDPGPVRPRLCGWPTTRPRCRCPARRCAPWPRSRRPPAAPSPLPRLHGGATMTMLILALAVHHLAAAHQPPPRHAGRAGGERARTRRRRRRPAWPGR